MKNKLNKDSEAEILCTLRLTKEMFPIAFEHKVQEMLSSCPDLTRDEVEELIPDMEIQLELYYEEGYGLMAIDSEAIGGCTPIYSPYTGEPYEDCEE
jgi:hypothetical protein